MITTGELKKGITIELDNKLYQVLDYQHIKMGRGSAQVRLRLKDIRAGHIIERTFQAGDKFQRARLEQRPVQFLYTDGDLYHFMDVENFEQTALGRDILSDAVNYLRDGMVLQLLTYGDEAIGVELPITVDLQVTRTDPGFKGDTATGGNKPAQLETGLTVNVPLFVNTGDVIRVDTRSGQYLERVIS